jgi:rhamnogalacturonan endolyase
MVVQAYRYEKGALKNVWRWDNVGLGKEYQGQGAHWTHAADVDGDGREELLLGSIMLDDDGKPLWTTGLGHPDHAYIGDIDPQRPGLEIYYGIETAQKKNGMCLVEAATGKILWGHEATTRHVHGQGLCADLDAAYPGSECYSADTDEKKDFAYARLRSAAGQVLSEEDLGGFAPEVAWWDADAQRELVRKGRITDLDGTVQDAPRIEGNVIAVADIVGDWREEIVTTVAGELRVYATTIPAVDRRVTPLADPIYRGDVTHATMGYYQAPMLGYDLQSTTAP